MAVITVDQLISGGSNVLIAILAARLLNPTQFGLFGIVFLVYMILVGISRGLVSDLVLVHPTESRERPGDAIGAALVVSTPVAIALAGVGYGLSQWNHTLGVALIVLAACLPLLVLQDVGRYLSFATRRPMRAVVLDSVWLVVMFALVAVLATRHGRTLASVIAAWGGSGAVAGVMVFVWYDVRQVRLSLAWIRSTWALGWRYLLSYFSMQGAALGMTSEIGGIAGTRALAGVQGTLVLVRPYTVFQTAISTAVIGEVAHAAGEPRRIWRQTITTSTLTGAIAAVTLAVMVALPTRLGHTLLGASWHLTQPLLLPAGLQIVVAGLVTGPLAALLGMKAVRKALTLNVCTTVVMLIGAGAGAAANGAKGALWLVDAGVGLMMVVTWVTLAMHLRNPETASAAVQTGGRTLAIEAAAPAFGLAAVLESGIGALGAADGAPEGPLIRTLEAGNGAPEGPARWLPQAPATGTLTEASSGNGAPEGPAKWLPEGLADGALEEPASASRLPSNIVPGSRRA